MSCRDGHDWWNFVRIKNKLNQGIQRSILPNGKHTEEGRGSEIETRYPKWMRFKEALTTKCWVIIEGMNQRNNMQGTSLTIASNSAPFCLLKRTERFFEQSEDVWVTYFSYGQFRQHLFFTAECKKVQPNPLQTSFDVTVYLAWVILKVNLRKRKQITLPTKSLNRPNIAFNWLQTIEHQSELANTSLQSAKIALWQFNSSNFSALSSLNITAIIYLIN